MKIVTVTFAISDVHNIDSYRERAIARQLQRVQENSEHGLQYVSHTIADLPDSVVNDSTEG